MRPHLSRFLLAAAAVTLVFLTGCLGSTEVRGIAVELTEVRAQPTAAGGAELTLTIRYINENLVPIAASGARHDIALNGLKLGRVESKEPIGLPQMGSATQTLTLQLNPEQADRLRASARSGSGNYQLETLIRVLAGEEKMESKTAGSGTVDLSNLGL